MEVAGEDIQTLAMDHHGLVAAVCRDLGLAAKLDERIGTHDERRRVSPGQAVVAMILNGLGFTNRRLYLTHQFFENKPVERLLGAPIQAADLTDYTLGHALDEIAAYGSSQLFGEVAFEVALEHDLLSTLNHIDTTSFSVQGKYAEVEVETVGEADEEEKKPQVIRITHGYSKDHRPDLKQVVLLLAVNGASGMPLWMEALDGNRSDKKSLAQGIENIRAFQKQIKLDASFKWVADSGLYTQEKLLKQNDYLWLCRVPEKIKEAQALVEKSAEEITWQKQADGYEIASFDSNYGDQPQRWLLVFSKQAYEREKQTFEKKLAKQEAQLKQALWHLSHEVFNCEQDAKTALNKLQKAYSFHTIKSTIKAQLKYAQRGKPKAGEEKKISGYQIEAEYERNTQAINHMLHRKGRFILATNDLDTVNYPAEKMLQDYKEQQTVERGFRFLKDPWFMVDSIFLKTPQRIEALMMVMTLCLMVYNVAQYKLRQTLQTTQETLPNQLNKPVQNPTLRWIFQLMEGVSIVRFYHENIRGPIKELITNLNALRQKIIRLFGHTACQIYGLIQKNPSEVLGM